MDAHSPEFSLQLAQAFGCTCLHDVSEVRYEYRLCQDGQLREFLIHDPYCGTYTVTVLLPPPQ